MEANQSVIESRMDKLRDNHEHTNSPLNKEDIIDVMKDYKHFVEKSTIGPVVHVDTSSDSPEETLEKVTNLIIPYLTKDDFEK